VSIVSDFLSYQGPEFSLAHRVMTLEHAQSLMTRCCHYTKIVVSFQAPVVDVAMPQIVKGEILNPGVLAGRGKGRLIDPTEWPA
jgi:hypothetical protein